jgi:hypothetical protein
MFCVPGIVWLAIQSRWREHVPASQPEATPSAAEEVLEGRVG